MHCVFQEKPKDLRTCDHLKTQRPENMEAKVAGDLETRKFRYLEPEARGSAWKLWILDLRFNLNLYRRLGLGIHILGELGT